MGGKLTKNCIAVSPFVGTFSIIPGTNVFQLVTVQAAGYGVSVVGVPDMSLSTYHFWRLTSPGVS